MSMIVGTSLGGCVKDIVEGKVQYNDVTMIHTGTRARNEAELMNVAQEYCKSGFPWEEIATEAMELVKRLFRDGKINQPALNGERLYGRNPDGMWTTEEKLQKWLDSMDEDERYIAKE